jgi:CBS domain-containing protein
MRVYTREEASLMKRVARDIMNPNVVTVTDTMDLREAATIFVEERITGAPVIDELGNLVGVLSQSDLVEYELATERELTEDAPFYRRPYDESLDRRRGFRIEELPAYTVRDVMTPYVITVKEDTSIPEVAARMAQCGIHRVIVVSEDQQIRGIVTSLDVLGWVAQQG